MLVAETYSAFEHLVRRFRRRLDTAEARVQPAHHRPFAAGRRGEVGCRVDDGAVIEQERATSSWSVSIEYVTDSRHRGPHDGGLLFEQPKPKAFGKFADALSLRSQPSACGRGARRDPPPGGRRPVDVEAPGVGARRIRPRKRELVGDLSILQPNEASGADARRQATGSDEIRPGYGPAIER